MELGQKIVDTNMFSSFFPGDYSYEIERDNLLDNLEKNLEKVNFIYITGETGSGKTVLLKQLCERSESISTFISLAKPISTSLEIIIQDLIKQIVFLTKGEIVDSLPESLSQLKIKYTRELTKLDYYASRNGKVNFVLDGLYHASENSEGTIEAILQELIPVGKRNLNIILSLDDSSNRVRRFIDSFQHKKKEYR